ncbi:NAD(P)-binding protein [Fistulina hepatica ATCC 64428]|uniref:NAD(P)-binding protein n=1 Tax=Fistulina hepatica ATCC 64428 TaxID=1128425 RepID=A0A0D7AC80_9AGAR|nr:NAD(P)-binding protein [Fistulina hepatica ATCC 64428]
MGGFFSRQAAPDFERDLEDMTGKVVIVTGANTGIGLTTVKYLARKGAKVYLGARNESKATGALAQLESEGVAPGQVLYLHVDLSDPRSAKKAAGEFMKRETRLDVLSDHISPFLCTHTLLPLMKKTAQEPASDVRIINVASNAHKRTSAITARFRTPEELNRDHTDAQWSDWSRYAVSKLANVMHASALQRRLSAEDIPIVCMSLHPGVVNTWADRTPAPIIANVLFYFFGDDLEFGAYTSCFAAASPLVREEREHYEGAYLVPLGQLGGPGDRLPRSEDIDLQDELWNTTEVVLENLGLL